MPVHASAAELAVCVLIGIGVCGVIVGVGAILLAIHNWASGTFR